MKDFCLKKFILFAYVFTTNLSIATASRSPHNEGYNTDYRYLKQIPYLSSLISNLLNCLASYCHYYLLLTMKVSSKKSLPLPWKNGGY